MAQYINKKINAKEITIYNTSDWHVGSKAFNDRAAKELVEMVKEDNAYLTFGGDAIEGKPVGSKHFDPKGLCVGEIDIEAQYRSFCEIMRPIKSRILMVQTGNHELYLLKDIDIIGLICENLGIQEAYGHYQTWLNVNGCSMHFWHGRPSMPRGAKDPIQREANQKAWLKNTMSPLAGSAQAHYMGHTHHCLVVEPVEQYALLDGGENVRGEYFVEQVREINGKVWTPPDARWYVNTGTLRRNGRFDYQDYAEIAGYNPPACACTKTTIKDGKIKDIKKVML